MVVNDGVPRSFTHVAAGTAAAAWRQQQQWGTGAPLRLEGIERLVVVAAHPDDESLGAGGLVATATAAGLQVTLVCATDGEGSHPDSSTCTPQQLADLRAREARRAAELLGVPSERLHRLGHPDGQLAEHESHLAIRLVEIVGDGRATVIVAPWRSDGHPDHEAAGRAASAAARRTGAELWEYPIWFWHWAAPEDAPWALLRPFRLEEGPLTAKQQAIHAHLSQVGPLSDQPGDETLLSPELLEHFADGPEHYLSTLAADCTDDVLDRLHQERSDPWGVESRWYERRKRDLVLAMLPREDFRHAVEVGCSTGALAEALLPRVRQLLAVDQSLAATSAARRRFHGLDRVTVAQLDVPEEWPSETVFDLVVVSEVGYFLSPTALERLVVRIAESLAPDGVVVLCHWRHPVEGWVLDAAAVHERFEVSVLPPLAATYRDRDIEVRVHSREVPDPLR